MSISQEIFRAHNLGSNTSLNLSSNNNHNNTGSDLMDIDNININAVYQQPFNRNNYRGSYQDNYRGNNNRGRNPKNRGRIRYEWFKDTITKETFEERMKNGVCILCGSWQHIMYKCPDIKNLGKV